MFKRYFPRYAFLAAVVIWLGVIFFFSAQEGEASGGLSGAVIEKLCAIFTPQFRQMGPDERITLIDSLQGIVRELAHGGVYGVLAVFVALFMSTFPLSNWKAFFIALAFCVLYAASDEFHQYFVPGRSCELGDVLVDSFGALLGLTLCHLCFYVNRKRKERRHE